MDHGACGVDGVSVDAVTRVIVRARASIPSIFRMAGHVCARLDSWNADRLWASRVPSSRCGRHAVFDRLALQRGLSGCGCMERHSAPIPHSERANPAPRSPARFHCAFDFTKTFARCARQQINQSRCTCSDNAQMAMAGGRVCTAIATSRDRCSARFRDHRLFRTSSTCSGGGACGIQWQ